MTHNTREVEDIVDKLPYHKENTNGTVSNIRYYERAVVIKALHHQLQKARHDWLKSEIEKLEGMKEVVCSKGGFGHEHNPWGCGTVSCKYCKHHEEEQCEQKNKGFSNNDVLIWNQALQTIITRYKEELLELDQDNK